MSEISTTTDSSTSSDIATSYVLKRKRQEKTVKLDEAQRKDLAPALALLAKEFPSLESVFNKLVAEHVCTDDDEEEIKIKPASAYTDVYDAARELDLEFRLHSLASLFELRRRLVDKEREMSADIAPAVQLVIHTPYKFYNYYNNDARTVIDLILLDRLRCLKNQESMNSRRTRTRTTFTTRVPMRISAEDSFHEYDVRGTPDWTLEHKMPHEDRVETNLVVVEIKLNRRRTKEEAGFPQLVVYMAAAQRSLGKAKHNRTVYGILSNGVYWEFAILTSERKLFVSPHSENIIVRQSEVICYVDWMLKCAVKDAADRRMVEKPEIVRLLEEGDRFLERTWRLGLEGGEKVDSEEDEEKKGRGGEGEPEGEKEISSWIDGVAREQDGVIQEAENP